MKGDNVMQDKKYYRVQQVWYDTCEFADSPEDAARQFRNRMRTKEQGQDGVDGKEKIKADGVNFEVREITNENGFLKR